MVVLVVNHLRLDSPLGDLTRAVLSAAEVLVAVSGVAVGMVFGRRWLRDGGHAVTLLLLRRARTLYLAALAVGLLVGLARMLPGDATAALTVPAGWDPSADLYSFDGPLRTAVAIVTLEAGPWQLSILGFFAVILAVTPALLWVLDRGHWPLVLLGSWLLFAAGRHWPVDVLPAQSERVFPILVWQVLFVHGLLLGFHRDRLRDVLRTRRRPLVAAVVLAALAAAGGQVAGAVLLPAPDWAAWQAAHFDKGSLDPARLLAMVAIAAGLYTVLRWRVAAAERLIGGLVLPLGRSSFYVFVMHVPVCLAVAAVAAPGGAGLGPVGNLGLQVAAVAGLWLLVRHEVLFRWVPR